MGWSAHDLPKNPEWKLWTRGGMEGVFIRKEGSEEEIHIPAKLLIILVGDHILSSLISRLEDINLVKAFEYITGDTALVQEEDRFCSRCGYPMTPDDCGEVCEECGYAMEEI